MTFEEALPLIKTICWRWCTSYNLLDFDEFVNEIWLRCEFHKFTAFKGQGLSRYIEYRIIDYIRDTFGRYDYKKNDGKSTTVRIGAIEYAPARKESGFDAIDSNDEFEWLISDLQPRTQRIVDMYYRQGIPQEKIGMALGLHKSRISQLRIAALEQIRRKAG